MNITTVKSSIKNTVANLRKLATDVRYLINEINSLSIETSISVIEPCNNLIYNLEISEIEINKLYNITSSELHIFFKDINNKMMIFNGGNGEINNVCNTIISLANLLYELHLLNISMEGLLEFTMDISEIQIFNSQLYMYSFEIENFIMELETNDNKLILPRR